MSSLGHLSYDNFDWSEDNLRNFAHSLISKGMVPTQIQPDSFMTDDHVFVITDRRKTKTILLCSHLNESNAQRIMYHITKITESPLYKVLNP